MHPGWKVEAFNRLITSAFLAEIAPAKLTTLDQLNEAWLAWSDGEYNVTDHGETGEPPRSRWRRGLAKIAFADEDKLRTAFLWTEKRTPDKSGIFSLFGTEYQVGPELAKKVVEVKYDPESLGQVEVWFGDRLIERAKPFVVQRHRRPLPPPKSKAAAVAEKPAPAAKKATANWLGYLVARRRAQNFVEPTPQALAEDAHARRMELDASVVDVLAARLDPGVVDSPTIRTFLDRVGPWDPSRVTELLDLFLRDHPRDSHIQVVLDALHAHLKDPS